MSSLYRLLDAASALASPMAQSVRRRVARRLLGRTLIWRVHAIGVARLRAGGMRLRLYGVSELPDLHATLGAMSLPFDGQRVRLRIVGIDSDGTLAVVLRHGGNDVTIELLLRGLVAVRGSGAGRHRKAQAHARAQRSGLWRWIEEWSPSAGRRPPIALSPWPWWQG